MRKAKEVLRLHAQGGLTLREIATSCHVSHTTVANILKRAEQAGISWPLPEGIDETTLENRLFPSEFISSKSRPMPDVQYIYNELKRKHVTLRLLWEEYKAANPDGLQYSQFCDRYRIWRHTLDVSMRQEHIAGEKMFVDYAGDKVPIINSDTGEMHEASLFLAVLGASNYTFAEPQWSQDLVNWIDGHCNALTFFSGVPKVFVPDNLKSGVKDPCYYEPDANPTYQDLALHYGAVVIPARVRKPKDKAKVENGVLVAERWILARLRNRRFFSLAELKLAISEELEILNNKPFQVLEGCRRSMYEKLDRPALQPLPAERFVYREYAKPRVNIDYHVMLDDNYYSVPHQLLHQKLDAYLTKNTVEIFHKGQRVASHKRFVGVKGQYATDPLHMPAAHRKYREWPPSRLISWGENIGPNTGELIKALLESKPHPELGYRSCLGIFRLSGQYGAQRLEAAAQRALACKAITYKSIKSILENGLDQIPYQAPEDSQIVPIHKNVRGSLYYSGKGATTCS